MMKYFDSRWRKTGLVIGIVLAFTLIVNFTHTAYIAVDDSFTANMQSLNRLESLDVQIRGTVERPSPLTYYLNQVRNLLSSYYVGGSEATQASTGIIVSITGINVASTASADYYIEAVAGDSSGNPYRFLEGNGTSITVDGANLTPTNQTTITHHLAAMGLSTTASHTIDYYVYVKAQATGAISGETLTSEIVKTKFDSVTFDYGSEVSDTFYSTGGLVNFQQYPTYTESMSTFKVILRTGKSCYGYLMFPLSGVGEVVTDAQLTYRCSSVYSARTMAVYRITETWGLSSNKPTWNNMPTVETEDSASQTPTDYWNYLDITEMAQAWGGGAGKFGIMMNIPSGASSSEGHTVFNTFGDFP
ncbi:MAG: DNRLRE domain-containing protein, partial [Chloroflexi bacterium]|nr:DNRLRE domain-containing protein [Chloroflexota bacterium]